MFISVYGIEKIKVPKFLINHANINKVTWDAVILVCTLYTAILVPVNITFEFVHMAMTVIETMVDLLFIIDIILTFFTTFIDANDKLVSNPKLIRRAYLKGWFTMDFISAIPYSAVGFAFEEGSVSELHTLLAFITPALSQRRPILRRPLFRQEQISTYRHIGPLLTPR